MSIVRRQKTNAAVPMLLRNQALLCSVALAVGALISRPFVEMGINDDFTYIRSALHLAQTGHIAYFGWGSPILGWQLYLGALFIKLFGFSFSGIRFSGLLVATATVYLLHRTMVRCGITETNATVGTLCFALSPIFLPLAFSFMTDVPGTFSLLLCIYLCLRALQAITDSAAINWLILAAVSNVLSGTVRQTSWLGVIVIVPSALWLLRKRRFSSVKMAIVWLSCLFCIYACLSWFNHQPYVERISLLGDIQSRGPMLYIARNVYHFVISIPLFLLPVLAAFFNPVWMETRRARVALSISVAALVLVLGVGFYHLLHQPGLGWLAPWGSNYVTSKGLIDIPDIGARPTVLGTDVRIIISFLVFAALVIFAACAFSTSPVPKLHTNSTIDRSPTSRELALLVGPFTIAYFALLLPRGAVGLMFDRYLLPLLAVALIFVLRFYQQRLAVRLPAISVVCVIVVGAYSVAAMHDLYSMERARLAAADELQAAGVPRTAFYGGAEIDGWTQIDSWGYVWPFDINPSPGLHPTPSPDQAMSTCEYVVAWRYPAIQPRYALSFDPQACDGPSGFAPVPYRTWLPPQSGFIYLQAVTASNPQLRGAVTMSDNRYSVN